MDPIQIAIVVIVMLVGAVRWFVENVVQKGGQSSQDGSVGDTLEDLYEEARREIQERQARMYPEDEELAPRDPTPPPIPTTRAPSPPPIPQVARTAAATPRSASRGRSEESAFYQLPEVKKPRLSKAEQDALARVQDREKESRRDSRSERNDFSSVRALLSTPQAARKAVVLREILGPPKGAA